MDIATATKCTLSLTEVPEDVGREFAGCLKTHSNAHNLSATTNKMEGLPMKAKYEKRNFGEYKKWRGSDTPEYSKRDGKFYKNYKT